MNKSLGQSMLVIKNASVGRPADNRKKQNAENMPHFPSSRETEVMCEFQHRPVRVALK
jgi:hypothetical protein